MKNVQNFQAMKDKQEKIVMLTAYDAPTAAFAEESDIDLILVGDSVGMVVLGYESTIFVTTDDMIHHTKAVRRGAKNTFVVSDMPFMTYHSDIKDTLITARRLMQEAGANAVKLEGASGVTEHIHRLTQAGVPVVAHLGLTPQSVAVLGGYKVQGKTYEAAEQLIKDAKAVEEAGAFMLVLECIPKQLAKIVSNSIRIPTIGIGAGVDCDGQVLVYHDLIGYGSHRLPKFVKPYTQVSKQIVEAICSYKNEVKNSEFPKDEHSYEMNHEEEIKLYGGTLS